MLRQPDFVVDSRLFDDDARALVYAGQEEANGHRVDALDVELLPLGFVFVDPGAEAELGQKFGFFSVPFVAGARFGVDYVGVASPQRLDAGEVEVVGIGNFTHKLTAIFALFLFFFLTLFAVFVGFVLALLDQLLDFLFFFLGVFLGEWLVVFGDEGVDRVAVEFHDFFFFRFPLFYLATGIQLVLFFALDVGVVALAFVVLHVIFRRAANEIADLVLGERLRRRGFLAKGGPRHQEQKNKRSAFCVHGHNYEMQPRMVP